MKELKRDWRGDTAQIVAIDHTLTQVVDGTAASAASSVIDNNESSWVRIAAYGDVHIAFGTDPTATAAHIFLPAGAVEWFEVNSGHKIAVLGGKINICPAG